MKILVLNPPFHSKYSRSSRSPAKAKGGTIYYPIWLAYTAGLLEKENHTVELVDAPAKNLSKEDVLEIAKTFQPNLIISDTSTASIYNDAYFLQQLKKETNAFTCLVGTHVSALPLETLKTFQEIDAVAIHEYDYIIRDLAQQLSQQNPDLTKVKGLVYRTQEGIKQNSEMPLIQDLDSLPFVSKVYKKYLNPKDYFYSANLYPEITIVSSRGCPYQCKFCVWPQTLMGHQFRTRSLENLLDELEYIEKEFPEVKEIMFEDDTFTANKERILDFSRLYNQRGLKITWSANARADLDYETLKAMKDCNCRLLCVGIESADQTILNNIRKGTTVNGIKQFMKDSKKAGILIHGCFMMGNQGETKESIRKTIDLAKEINPDTAQFFPIMVYPGTATYKEFKEAGYLTTSDFREWLNKDGQHNTIVSRPNLTNTELVQYCDLARKEFYMRPSYILKKVIQAITQPREAIRILKSSKTFFKYLFFGSGFETSHSSEKESNEKTFNNQNNPNNNSSSNAQTPKEETQTNPFIENPTPSEKEELQTNPFIENPTPSEKETQEEKKTNPEISNQKEEEIFFPRTSCSGCPLANQCSIKDEKEEENENNSFEEKTKEKEKSAEEKEESDKNEET